MESWEIKRVYSKILPTELKGVCFLCGTKAPINPCHVITIDTRVLDIQPDYRNTIPACGDCKRVYGKLSGNPYKSGRTKLNALKERALHSKSLSKFFLAMADRYLFLLDTNEGEVVNPYQFIPGVKDEQSETGIEDMDRELVSENEKSQGSDGNAGGSGKENRSDDPGITGNEGRVE